MRVPFFTGVLIVTTIPIRVAHPTAPRSLVIILLAVLRLLPASVPIIVALHAHAMIAIRVAALICMSQRGTGSRQSEYSGEGEQRILEHIFPFPLGRL